MGVECRCRPTSWLPEIFILVCNHFLPVTLDQPIKQSDSRRESRPLRWAISPPKLEELPLITQRIISKTPRPLQSSSANHRVIHSSVSRDKERSEKRPRRRWRR